MWAALFGLMFVCSTMILPSAAAQRWCLRRQKETGAIGAAIEADIDVAVSCDLQSSNTLDWTDFFGEFLCDFSWRLAERFGELKRDGQRQLAKRCLARLLYRNRDVVNSVTYADVPRNCVDNSCFELVEQPSVIRAGSMPGSEIRQFARAIRQVPSGYRRACLLGKMVR